MNRFIAKIPKGFSKKINKTVISGSEVEKVLPSKTFSEPPHIPATNSHTYFPPHPDYQGSNIFSIPVKNIKKNCPKILNVNYF